MHMTCPLPPLSGLLKLFSPPSFAHFPLPLSYFLTTLPLQYSCLENPMDGGAWWAAVPGVAESWTRLSDFTFTFHFHALEKEMATHSSVLAWRIPGTVEPGGLPPMGSHRVGHDWSDLPAAAEPGYSSALSTQQGNCSVYMIESRRMNISGGNVKVLHKALQLSQVL